MRSAANYARIALITQRCSVGLIAILVSAGNVFARCRAIAWVDSVAPLVNVMRSASQPITVPKFSRACCNNTFTRVPARCALEGFCHDSSVARNQASRAAGLNGVVAL